MRLSAWIGLAMLAGTTTAFAAEPVVLKLSADTPSSGATWQQIPLAWAKKVEADSHGAIKFELYPDGQLSKAGDTINRVEAGVVDVGWDLPQLYGARFAGLLVTSMPGLYTDPVKAAAAMWRGYEKGVIGQELKGFKVIFLQPVPNAAYYLKAPPKANTDLSGLKVALANKSRAAITEALGGVPVAISTTEYYQAISKGVADGTMTTTGAIQAYKIDEITHYFVFGAFGGGTNIMVMNKAKYDALPPEAKKAIDANSGLEASRFAAKALYDFENGYMANTMLKIAGNRQVWLSKDEEAKLRPVFDTLVKDWTSKTPNGQSIYDTFKAELAAGN